jgi:hypothetical protein
MKKMMILAILSALLVLFTMNSTFAGAVGGTVKLGIDMAGDHDVSAPGDSKSYDVDTGFSLSGEVFGKIGNNFDVGAGITIQIPRSVEDFEGDFMFIPVYGMIRARIETENVAPYFIGQLGYNFFLADDDYKGAADLTGGLYYGLGLGIIIKKHFLIEALYSVNNGTYELSSNELDIENSQVTLNFGYNF